MPEHKRASGTLHGLRALVAEDDFHIALVIETALETAGIEIVATVSRVERAVEIARREKPDFAVVDIRLGESYSFPLIRQLRNMGTKVVLATGTEPNSEIAGEFSDIPVLRKPYTAEQLIKLIRSIL